MRKSNICFGLCAVHFVRRPSLGASGASIAFNYSYINNIIVKLREMLQTSL